MTRQEAGKLGYVATLQRHGKDQWNEWRKLGGEKKCLTVSEIRQKETPIEKEERASPGNLWEFLTHKKKVGLETLNL